MDMLQPVCECIVLCFKFDRWGECKLLNIAWYGQFMIGQMKCCLFAMTILLFLALSLLNSAWH